LSSFDLYKVNLLEAKKQYVRYITHEIRTPLNSVYLGLQLLADDLQHCANEEDAKRYENLCAVQLSCTTALDTVNDLLTFEKLESGLMLLNKEEVIAMNLLSECVRMFSAQAKAHRVNLVIRELGFESNFAAINNIDSTLRPAELTNGASERAALPMHQGAVPLNECDTVYLDKFKIAQVIRNQVHAR
jgi:signal transduction histidine kinase